MTRMDKRFRNLAKNMIAKYGKEAVFTVTTPGVFDPVTGTTTGQTTTDTMIKITPPQSFGVDEVNGTTIQSSDLKVSVAALDYTPDIDQTVTFDGDTYNIVGIAPVYSGDLIAKFDCQLRR